MLQPHSPPLATVTRLLGFAGLIPQLIALLLIATGIDPALGALLAFMYAAMILSFIGGIWWGFSVGHMEGQAGLSAIAVMPTIVAATFAVARLFGMPAGWALVAIGSAILLTLPIDSGLMRDGRAPREWMAFRIPLSIGLGVLTIIAGTLAPGAITVTYTAVN